MDRPQEVNGVTLDRAIEVLNEALAIDPLAITWLMTNRVPCNLEFLNHPTIQVGWLPKDGSNPEPGTPNVDDGNSTLALGMIGLLNGIFGCHLSGEGFICAEFDEVGGPISRFAKTKGR